jgi:hypothetical protein
MKIGDLAPMTSCTVVYGDKSQSMRLSFKAPKGRRMVFMLLGDEAADGSDPIDGKAVLEAMGWEIRDEKAVVTG